MSVNSRLYYITGSGGELPASAADTIGINDENIVQAQLEFECIYCGTGHRTVFALPADPEKEFTCDTCNNTYELFEGVIASDAEDGYKATDLRTLPSVLDSRERVRRLALRTDSIALDWVSRGIPQTAAAVTLVVSFFVLIGAAINFGSPLGQGLTLLGFGLLITAATIPTVVHALARREAEAAGVTIGNIELVAENREVYKFVKDQQEELLEQLKEQVEE